MTTEACKIQVIRKLLDWLHNAFYFLQWDPNTFGTLCLDARCHCGEPFLDKQIVVRPRDHHVHPKCFTHLHCQIPEVVTHGAWHTRTRTSFPCTTCWKYNVSVGVHMDEVELWPIFQGLTWDDVDQSEMPSRFTLERWTVSVSQSHSFLTQLLH
jgi:hypothetical protein